MKTVLLFFFMAFFLTSKSQAYLSLSGGVGNNKFYAAPSIGFKLKCFVVQGGYKAIVDEAQPVIFDLHLGYQYKFIEAGYSGGVIIHTLDKANANASKNSQSHGFYVRGYWGNFFGEYQRQSNINFFGIGVREFIGKKKD